MGAEAVADRVDQAERQLGEVLRLLRLEARMSQRDLALRIGFHENAVSSFERGERAPSAQYLTGFVTALHLPPDTADTIWRLYRQEPQPQGIQPPREGGEEPPCPYRGLSAFREPDARFFHGRDAAVARIIGKLEASQLVAVVGASGSGKSSVVFAGVVPRLRRSADWDVLSLRPGPDPSAAFVGALSADTGRAAAAAAVPNPTATTIVAGLGARTRRSGMPTLVVIDQFEELFTHGAAPATVDGFLTLIVHLTAARRRVPVKVLLTFRGDFYGQVIARRDFSDLLQDNVVHLPPMSRAELRQAVVEPARLVGLALDNGLVDRILDDAGTEPGNLPLLEFALTRLWDMRRGMSLTHEAYRQIGHLAGAITARAEEVYLGLSPEQQYAARQLLVRLVQVARPEEDGNDARRRTPIVELATLPRVDAVISALADARLVVTDADNTLGPTVELSHEAIIRSWERLRVWLVEDRQFLLWQQRARQWVAEWRHAEGHPDTLLHGSLLDEAQRWVAVKGRDGIAADLLDYVQASIREHEAETRRQALNRIDQLLTVVPREVPEVAATFPEESDDVHAVLRGRLDDVPEGQR
jgi:transcriptional regulator with XRE-family HTH domain